MILIGGAIDITSQYDTQRSLAGCAGLVAGNVYYRLELGLLYHVQEPVVYLEQNEYMYSTYSGSSS